MAEDRDRGEVVSVAEHALGVAYVTLHVWIPENPPGICFLVSGRSEMLTMSPGLTGGGLLPLGLARDRNGVASLYDVDSGLWVCAVPPGEQGSPAGRLAIARQKIDAYEIFHLLPVLKVFVPPPVIQAAGRIEAMLGSKIDLAQLRTMPADDAPILSAVARLMPLDRLEALSRALVASPDDARALARLFPDDIMGREGLPKLAEWLADRDGKAVVPVRSGLFRLGLGRGAPAKPKSPEPPPEQTIPAASDALSTLGVGGEFGSVPYACTALARRSVVPRRDLCIVATARNEGLYILEWLAYHRAIGFEAIFLYTNDNDDGSDALLSALARGGALRWAHNEVAPGGNAQGKAYGHALGMRPEVLDYRWALLIDLDEYFVFNTALFPSAREFVRWQETRPCDAIALNWVFYGSSGAVRWHDDFIVRRFPHPGGEADMHIKTMCRPNRFTHSTPHYPLAWRKLPFVFHSSAGEDHIPRLSAGTIACSDQPSKDYAWINHYFFKSSEEYLLKWSRNRGDYATLPKPTTSVLTAEFVRAFMQQFTAPLRPPTNTEECAPAFKQEFASLMSLPGVAEAWADVKQKYTERVTAIVPMFAEAPGILEAGETGQAFLATLGL